MTRVVVALFLLSIPALAHAQTNGVRQTSAQEDRARVTQPAPLMLQPDASRQPLRMAATGTSLVVLKEEGDWLQVQFQDPQFGLRTGYIERKYVQLQPATFTPVDLSVPDTGVAARVGSRSRTRAGAFFSAGFGYSSLGCDCGARVNGAAADIVGGVAVSDYVELAAGNSEWIRSENNFWAISQTTDFRVRIYPSRTAGFYVTGGLGLASVEVGSGSLSVRETGTGYIGGVGWNLPVTRSMSIAPFWNVSVVHTDFDNVNFHQFGAAFNFHR